MDKKDKMLQFIGWLCLTLFLLGLSWVSGYRTKDTWDEWHKKTVENNRMEIKPKLEIKDSNLHKSPIVIDSPNSVNIVGDNNTVNARVPERHLDTDGIKKMNLFLQTINCKEVNTVGCNASSREACQFAIEIIKYLQSQNGANKIQFIRSMEGMDISEIMKPFPFPRTYYRIMNNRIDIYVETQE